MERCCVLLLRAQNAVDDVARQICRSINDVDVGVAQYEDCGDEPETLGGYSGCGDVVEEKKKEIGANAGAITEQRCRCCNSTSRR